MMGLDGTRGCESKRPLFTTFAILAVFILVLATGAYAMRVSPMVAELTTSGSGSIARIEVGNAGSALLPFETTITRIEMDSEGTLTETPGDEDFLVFPPQGLVPVSGRQVVRVQWVGPTIEHSRAYYLSVRQLPVETDPNRERSNTANISINVLYTMKALIVVSPPGVRPNVQVASATPTMIAPTASLDGSEADGNSAAQEAQPGIEVVVVNSGARHAMMSGATWIVQGTDTTGQPFSRTYTGSEISQSLGVGYLPAMGGRRVFNLLTGVALSPDHPVTVRFTQ